MAVDAKRFIDSLTRYFIHQDPFRFNNKQRFTTVRRKTSDLWPHSPTPIVSPSPMGREDTPRTGGTAWGTQRSFDTLVGAGTLGMVGKWDSPGNQRTSGTGGTDPLANPLG